jgi:DNA primase
MADFIDLQKLRDSISLVDFLSRLGYEPTRRSGKELMYISMLRMPESTPSFCVNDALGVWYDHGTGQGGTVIDFGKAYWQGLPFKEVLTKILQGAGLEPGAIVGSSNWHEQHRRPLPEKTPNYRVWQVKELGNNPAITAYLQYRNVWQVAQNRLKEIYYYVGNQQQNRKQFFSAGWQNEKGGWEVRNPYFKGCLGKKGMSFIASNAGRDLAVFEGYINYLSWLSQHQGDDKNILVLNTLSFLSPAIERCHSFDNVEVYFDHDHAGRAATEKLLSALAHARDRSEVYAQYNDYNDKLIAEIPPIATNLDWSSSLGQ